VFVPTATTGGCGRGKAKTAKLSIEQRDMKKDQRARKAWALSGCSPMEVGNAPAAPSSRCMLAPTGNSKTENGTNPVKTEVILPSPQVVRPRPFLRWAGGKQKLVKLLLPFVPPRETYNRYYEPFLGAGAVFFGVRPREAVIGDINSDLMNCYSQVSRFPQRIADLVRSYASRDCREFFYHMRAASQNGLTLVERAARFIYLNKAAFNGIYRVNLAGQFNVPYGPSPRGPVIPTPAALSAAAECLRNCVLKTCDFGEGVRDASAGDFIYLDPPYPPRSDTAFFAHYSKERFGWEEQLRVAKTFADLSARGCLVMLSNAGQRRVLDLYRGYRVAWLGAVRWLGSNGDRFRVREIVVTNYDPAGVCGPCLSTGGG